MSEKMPDEVLKELISALKTAHIYGDGLDIEVLRFCEKFVSPLEELLEMRNERDEMLKALRDIEENPTGDSVGNVNHTNHWTNWAKRRVREAIARVESSK